MVARHFVAVALLLGIAAVVSSLYLPVLRDEGGYLFIADRVAHGALYARDFLERKTPLLFYSLAGLFSLTGTGIQAARLAMAACVALSAWLLFRAARHAELSIAWAQGTVAAFLLSVPLFYASHALTEVPVMVCGIALVAILLKSSAPYTFWRWVVAGLLIGVGATSKQVAVFFLPAALMWLAIEERRAGTANRVIAAKSLVLCFAAALPLIGWVAYYSAVGALPEFVDAIWTTNIQYAGFGLRDWILNSFRAVFLRGAIVWVPIAVAAPGIIRQYLRREGMRAESLLLLLVACSVVPVLKRPYEHYIVSFLPIACLLAAILWRRWTSASPATYVLLGAAILMIGTVRHYAVYVIPPLAEGQLAQQERIATRISGYLQPGEPLYVLGAEPKYYVMTHHFHPDRVVFVLENWLSICPPETIIDMLKGTKGLRYVAIVEGNIEDVRVATEQIQTNGALVFTERVGDLETVSLYRVDGMR
jgi:hypothetical protein